VEGRSSKAGRIGAGSRGSEREAEMKSWITKWFLGGVVRDIAEGKSGEGPKKLYWYLSGKKTIVSSIAGLTFAALAAWKPQVALDWAPTVTFVLGLAVTIGIADREWKNAPPPEEWKHAYTHVLSAGPVIAAAFALVIQYLPLIPGCEACPSFVPQVQWAAGAFAAITAWLAARWNVPPVFPSRRIDDIPVK